MSYVDENSRQYVTLINNSGLNNGSNRSIYFNKAALSEKKHILVFVSPNVKESFMKIQSELKKLYELYIYDKHRTPNSPFDPFKDWIEKELLGDGIAKQFLGITDPFVWAFLYDVYNNGHGLYDFDVSKTELYAKNISAMLSTSLRSVIGLIAVREQTGELRAQAAYLMNYAGYTLKMFAEKNLIMKKLYRYP